MISGASGLVGTTLSNRLIAEGYEVIHLSRIPRNTSKIKVFRWDIESSYIDLNAFEGVHAIIHLAGESIAGKAWTNKRKQVIRDSREKGTDLLIQALEKCRHPVKTVISASAIGYYKDRGDEFLRKMQKLLQPF